MLSAGTPFVFLDDARAGGTRRLYRAPVDVVTARTVAEVDPALESVRDAASRGLHAAGYLSYEAGCALEPRLAGLATDESAPLLWFGLFERAETIGEDELAALLGDPAGAWVGRLRPGVERGAYQQMFEAVARLIAAGDIYQANLSFRSRLPVLGPPPAIYARLRARSAAGWGGIVHDGARWLLSCSPELFFATDGKRVTARPMKGTALRGRDAAEDEARAQALAADPKERAENLMIVDLLRNDLSRVARPGSVAVPRLFVVERYPTVQTMVSEVEAELAPGHDAIDVLRALFPCGSITGAPKVRAMEVIAATETDARGIYTGSIGHLAPDGGAAFNVAIRTLSLEEGATEAVLGLGSAVVADSRVDEEWAECLAKGAFAQADSRFDLIETMRFDPDDGLIELERHVARLSASARALDIRLDRHALRNELHTATFRLTEPARVRVRIAPAGAVAIQTDPLPAYSRGPLRVRVAPLPVDPRDWRLDHKTSDRAFYDAARRAAGVDEVIFARPDGSLSEGSFTSLFVRRGGARLVTPRGPGLLPGILRGALLASGEAEEGEVRIEDLAGGFLVGNALRGLMEAVLA